MEKKRVVKLVQQLLDEVGQTIDLTIIHAGVRRDGAWWYVPVLASRRGKDVPREVTVNIFANVEDELQQRHRLDALLIPVVPPAAVKRKRTVTSASGARRSARAPARG